MEYIPNRLTIKWLRLAAPELRVVSGVVNQQHAKGVVEFQDVDMKANYGTINNTRQSLFLEYERPPMIDEWQMCPVAWNVILNDTVDFIRLMQKCAMG